MTQSDHFFIVKPLKIPKMPLIYIILGISAIFACFLFWWATSLHGIGIRNDSVTYLWVAENLSKGIGFGITDAIGQFKPVTQLPPFYPFLLSICLWVASNINPQIDAEQISRLLGMLLTGATVWIFGRLTFKISSRSILFISLGLAILLSSPFFWNVYLFVTPEPLFIFLSLLAIYFFMEYLRTFLPKTLFLAGMFVGLSVLTGYVGFYLIPVMGISLLCFTRRSIKRNLFALNHIIATGLIPILLWEIRNYNVSGSLKNWQPVFTPITAAEWDLLRDSFYDWFNPIIELFKIVPLALIVLLAFSVLTVSLIIYYRKRVYGNNESQDVLWIILLLCLISYTVTFLSLKLFFSAAIPLEASRIFSLAHTGLLLVVISLLSNVKDIKNLVLGKYVLFSAFGVILIFAVLVIGINFQRTRMSLVNSHDEGLALNSSRFKHSPFSLALIGLKATKPLYFSDNQEKLYWLLAKTPSSVLGEIDKEIAGLHKQDIDEHDIVIVLIDDTWANVDVIKYYPSAQKIYKDADGAIFIMRGDPIN